MTQRLYLGRAGTGKTRTCLDQLAHAVRDGCTGLLLVPTYSQAEHLRLALLRQARGFDPGCVQTFTSLGERLTGLRVRDLASPAERDRVAAAALRLDFERGAEQPGFRAEFLAAVKEIKEQGLPDIVERARAKFLEGTRERSLFESYARYKDALTKLDHEDQQILARDRLRAGVLPTERALDLVLVDGFHDFTPVQQDMVEQLAGMTKDIVVTLPLDPDRDSELFETAQQTRHRFRNYEVVALRDNVRATKTPALAALEEHLVAAARFETPHADAPRLSGVGIETLACASEEDEADRLARLVRASGRSFADFLIVRRHFDGLQSLYRAAFARYGVPLRFFTPDPLGQSPAARAVALWLRADRAEALELLYLLRSPYFLDRPAAPVVDAWAHAIRRHEQPEDFWTAPESDAPLHEQLARSFGVRDALLQCPDGDESMARAASFFLVLDREARALDGLPLDEARDYLARRLPTLKGAWPDRRFDCVYAVEALHARQWEKPVVLVAGLTADAFPKIIREDVFLRDEQRAQLSEEHGIHLPLRWRREAEERYLFYVTMTRARGRLVLSWAAFNEDGGERACSSYVASALAPFDGVAQREVALSEQFAGPADAVVRADLLPMVADGLAHAHRGGGELAAALYERGAMDQKLLAWPRRLELVRRRPFLLGARDPVAPLSASRLRDYKKCPYLVWMKMLRLRRPRPFELDPIRRGEIVHAALERWAQDGVDPELAFDEVWEQETQGMRLSLQDEATRRIARAEVRDTAQALAGEPLHLAEKPIDTMVGDVRLVGKIDRIDRYPQGDLIRDYKTGRVSDDLTQLDVYLLAEPGARGAVFEWIHHGKTTGFVAGDVPAHYTGKDNVERIDDAELALRRDRVKETIAAVAQRARAGHLALAPADTSGCERGKCDGYDLCRVVRAHWSRKIARGDGAS